MTQAIRSVIRSTGSYLPEKILTNADLARMVDTSDDWIIQRTGIEQRHIAADGVKTSDMAVKAAEKALQMAKLTAADIDAVIVATTTPDLTFPSVAVHVQAALEIPAGPAFDVQAVCSGFIYALSIADSMIRTGQMRRALIIGAEKMSSIVDWTDRATCILFADGAGAVILEAQEQNIVDQNSPGVIASHLRANGQYTDLLRTDGGPSSNAHCGVIKMEGREVFKHAVEFLAEAVDSVLSKAGMVPADIDWLVPHQANIRILEATAKKLGMSMDRVIVTLQNHGNTSAASVPLALDHGIRTGKIKRGEMLLLEAMGGGFTWGAMLIRY